MLQMNPCEAAEVPKVIQREIKPLTDAEIPLFLKAIEDNPMRNAYALCLFAGLREGECLGLSWDQVDFEGKSSPSASSFNARRKRTENITSLRPLRTERFGKLYRRTLPFSI